MTDDVHCHLNKSQQLVNIVGNANHVHTCPPFIVGFVLILSYHLRICFRIQQLFRARGLTKQRSVRSKPVLDANCRSTVCPQLASVCSFFWRSALVGLRQLTIDLQYSQKTCRVKS